MTEIEPVYGAGTLLLIAAAAVALLLFLIMRVKLHAFVALVLVSVLTAIAAGIPVADVPQALLTGFSGTLGAVALLVGFGVMVGRLLEVTGGAQILADTLIARFGEKRAPLALGVAALIFGFPIFFDAGLVVFLPIIFTVARRFGGGILRYGLPTAGAFAVMHAVVPPHPGPVAAADLLGGNVGITLLIGAPVAVIAWFLGAYHVSRYLSARYVVDIPDAVFGRMNGGRDGDRAATEAGGDEGGGTTVTVTQAPPRFRTVLLILLLPLVLISLNTVVSTLVTTGAIAEDAAWAGILTLIGQTPVALLITVLVALVTLSPGRFSASQANRILDDALGPICSIILITGAGGMFGGVLRASGIGAALTDALSGLGLPLILQAFVIATVLRVAQGSATVALTTTAGLISAQVAAEGLSDVRIALLVFAVAAGATVLSHVNDSGFWLVSRFFGMDVRTTLKTWTVLETTLGVAVFLLAALLWLVTG
ncbi:GntP family permease [Myceligenerans xiligouense]|uniref:GntP family gluconate:H+ symporter n=1 Tax=Myceligenerans xiligouense TaxID=253184 RepID=A0A3N4YUH4_9MICO|nr:gluconate:H+ symporter [Myceligenerans xiligouense]RPF22230.1 GntP family gluconate:H+ symporter [Myceligenerans xiligouense]